MGNDYTSVRRRRGIALQRPGARLEARQPAAFQALLRAIDACSSRAALAEPGRQLYAARLPRAQAGVAWTRYRIRQATLYRRQHATGAPGLTPAEWRRLWAAYRARRPAQPA